MVKKTGGGNGGPPFLLSFVPSVWSRKARTSTSTPSTFPSAGHEGCQLTFLVLCTLGNGVLYEVRTLRGTLKSFCERKWNFICKFQTNTPLGAAPQQREREKQKKLWDRKVAQQHTGRCSRKETLAKFVSVYRSASRSHLLCSCTSPFHFI